MRMLEARLELFRCLFSRLLLHLPVSLYRGKLGNQFDFRTFTR